MLRSPRFAAFLSVVCGPLMVLGCGSSDAGPVGGPVMAALDTHCTVNGVMTKTETSMCIDLRQPADGSSDGGDVASDAASDAAMSADGAISDGGGDATASDDGGAPTRTPTTDCAGKQSGGGDFGPTICNSEGDDDDCKYHVAWTSSPIRRNQGVTFDVTATRLFDGMPATGADIQIEAFLSDTHPTPSLDTTTSESTDKTGRYRIGPVLLDQPGMWTVRFHLFQFCSDTTDDSPHGHAAFYVNVP